uniref:RNA polymerase II subunit A C-terminal domain phosphatase SSU72 n=1 Tax=Hyaloperonospora arabidopsidis (strain Emoy2) TaxID=559515 RepID=M4C153_HYAAE
MVCANNVNRSAAAHEILNAAGLRVCSYGAGREVMLAGPSSFEPRTFDFLTPYSTIRSILEEEDATSFTDNGVLGLLERDMSIKQAPERWQNLSNEQLVGIDVVVCLEYAVFLRVLQGGALSFPSSVLLVVQKEVSTTYVTCSLTYWLLLMLSSSDVQRRMQKHLQVKQLHVVCLDTVDTPEEAVAGGERVLRLCRELNVPLKELTEKFVVSVVKKFEKEHDQQLQYLGLHT